MKNTETNRERFVRIAEARTQKIIDMIELLGNCSNKYNYEYTQKDVLRGPVEATAMGNLKIQLCTLGQNNGRPVA